MSFVTVYIREAHPLDEWQMKSNETENVCYRQPRTLEDRVAIANDFVERFHYAIPLAVDPMENPADHVYAGWPERLYIVDESGRIAYKGRRDRSAITPRKSRPGWRRRFPAADRPPS